MVLTSSLCGLLAYLSESGKTRVSLMFSSAASVSVKLTRMIIKVGTSFFRSKVFRNLCCAAAFIHHYGYLYELGEWCLYLMLQLIIMCSNKRKGQNIAI